VRCDLCCRHNRQAVQKGAIRRSHTITSSNHMYHAAVQCRSTAGMVVSLHQCTAMYCIMYCIATRYRTTNPRQFDMHAVGRVQHTFDGTAPVSTCSCLVSPLDLQSYHPGTTLPQLTERQLNSQPLGPLQRAVKLLLCTTEGSWCDAGDPGMEGEHDVWAGPAGEAVLQLCPGVCCSSAAAHATQTLWSAMPSMCCSQSSEQEARMH
jgi:hypothetical protein